MTSLFHDFSLIKKRNTLSNNDLLHNHMLYERSSRTTRQSTMIRMGKRENLASQVSVSVAQDPPPESMKSPQVPIGATYGATFCLCL